MQFEILKLIYTALFHNTITYGIIAWGGAYTNNLQLIQNLQNRIVKIINKKNSPTNYYNNNKILKPLNFEQTFAYKSIIQNYKALNHFYTISHPSTRNKSLVIPIRHKTISSKNNYIKAISIFNSLPLNLKSINNVAKRKRLLKDWIFEKDIA